MNKLPENVVVLGGGWEPSVSIPQLSVESKIRVLALGTISESVNSTILSGGICPEGQNITEAAGMRDFLQEEFPANNLEVVLDEDCWDTQSSAQIVSGLLSDRNITGKQGLIASRTHLPRAAKAFRAHGVDVMPLEAEMLLLGSGSAQYKEIALAYLHSARYLRWLGKEAIMRSALVLDRNGKISQKMAYKLRASHLRGDG